jgi:hypothetical protein
VEKSKETTSRVEHGPDRLQLIILPWGQLNVAKTLAYYDEMLITGIKIFIVCPLETLEMNK